MKGLISLLIFIILGICSYANSTFIEIANTPVPVPVPVPAPTPSPSPKPPFIVDPDSKFMSLIIDFVPDYDKNNLSKTIDWTIEHADCLNSWSLSGWSKTTLDDNFTMSSTKIGLISGRIDYHYYLTHNPENDLPQERNRPRPVIFGIFFSKEF